MKAKFGFVKYFYYICISVLLVVIHKQRTLKGIKSNEGFFLVVSCSPLYFNVSTLTESTAMVSVFVRVESFSEFDVVVPQALNKAIVATNNNFFIVLFRILYYLNNSLLFVEHLYP